MINRSKVIALAMVLFMALPFVSCAQNKMDQQEGKRDLSHLSCDDFNRLGIENRNIVIGLLHGYFLGTKGTTVFNLAKVSGTSSKIIGYCRGHLEESILQITGRMYKEAPQQKKHEIKDIPSEISAKTPTEIPADIPAGLLAFPSAVGYGSKSVGGRGGKIIYVTTLEDNWEPGSLRYALYKESGPRIIIFRVAGIIELKEPRRASSKDIGIMNPYITIAGQTAPGDGICIKNGGIAIHTHDVIIRHLCLRPGDSKTGTFPEDRDAIKIVEGYNIVLDHISASWSIDETISTWFQKGSPPPHDITIQNSIISEGLYKSLHPKVFHSRGLLIGDHATNVTIFQNIFAHNNRRNPMVKGDTKNIDIINNVIYNWGNYKGFGTNFSDIENSGPTFTSIINNHYIKGPNSGDNYFYFDKLNKNSRILINGNSGDLSERAYRNKSKYPFVIDGAFNSNNISLRKINDTVGSLLQNSGAFVPVRDKVDKRIINEVKTKTGKIINTVAEVGGYPRLNGGTPFRDSDGDGISDEWESNHKMNPNDNSDSNKDFDEDGYTNIEEFLNELAGD